MTQGLTYDFGPNGNSGCEKCMRRNKELPAELESSFMPFLISLKFMAVQSKLSTVYKTDALRIRHRLKTNN